MQEEFGSMPSKRPFSFAYRSTPTAIAKLCRLHIAALLLFGGVCAAAFAQPAKSPLAVKGNDVSLGLTRVAIFSSGVGYFEADAKVDGEAAGELRFRTDQINDILRSLVVLDLGGG